MSAVTTQRGRPTDAHQPGRPVAALAGLTAWVVVIGAVVAVLATHGRESFLSQVVGNLAILAALLFCLVLCVRVGWRRGPARRAWIALAVAMLMGSLGQASYVASAFSASEAPPSVATDTVAFLGYAVPFFVALFLFPRPQDLLISRFRQILDVLVITLGTVLVSEATVLRPVRQVADLRTPEGLLLLAYPIVDVAICATVLCLGMRQRPGDRLSWLALGTGMVIVAATDSVYVRLLIEGQSDLTATPLAAGWMAAPVLIGLATLIPRRGRVVEASGTSLPIQLVPYVPVLGAVVVLILGGVRDDPFQLVGGVALLGAVAVRQIMIVWENVTLTHDLEAKVASRTAELTTLGSIVTSSSEAIVGISLDSRITAWNPAAERLYGYPAAEVIGQRPSFLPPDALQAVQTLVDDARRGEQLSAFEVDWERPDGTVLPVAMTVSPILDEDGVRGISIIGQDITERRRAAEYLEQAREDALESSRLKSEFLATMSHEIRTPMNGVIGLTSLLLETELDQLQRQYAEGVRGAGDALLTVINDILDFSKLEAGKVVLDPVDFDPHQLIEEVGALLAPAAAAKHLELIAYCTHDVPRVVRGDLQRIRQILLNLASNAVKFTAVGEVTVRAKAEFAGGDRVSLRFEVVDTGIGIATRDQGRLFQSFTQADASTTRRFGGTGLGLAISRGLVEMMDGRIDLESEEGVGSLFWFEIPLPLVQPPTTEPAASHDLLPGLRALVVDDNATNRMLLQRQLGSWQLQTDVAMDAPLAMELLRSRADDGHPYDLAVLDLQMPDVDGLQLAAAIQQDPVLAGMPLIMLTSDPRPDPEALTAAGVGQCVAKPVRSSELYERLVRLMAPREAELRLRERPGLADPVPAGSRGTVLVVEDNETNQDVADGIVSRLGYHVRRAADGAAALEIMERESFHAVLMDCHMPRMDGFEATREIRRREAGGSTRIPVIAMTAGALPEDRERCLAVGMDGYISKPIDVDALAAALAGVSDGSARLPVAPGRPRSNGDSMGVIDTSRLADLSELVSADGSGLLQALLSSFVQRSETRLEMIRAAAESGDRDALRSAAHDLKGAAGTIGAVRVARLCRELELAMREDRPVRPDLVTELATELEQANDELLGLRREVLAHAAGLDPRPG